MTDNSDSDRPDDVPPWWDENVEIREELDLPGYDAPKFEDDVYVHTVVEELEANHGCNIRLVDPSPSKLSTWEIRLDGEPIESVHRSRDSSANTVFSITSPAFKSLVEDAVAERE
ncbi:hypothetical protein [Haloferax marisrubri]|uniref:Uncharacterized protein n=1 Tax=Haloferax marisrubri TaxID=1544719 RepID=A0A2P4NMC4_9EURY|nr:hypothetical protein [Haloferax marisrubri]POG54270.1 hypothetical protein AUR65_016650 [Haloferax marisrubri]